MDKAPVTPGQLRFFGSESAELFTRQVAASYAGVLARNMITDPADPMVGFVSASIDGRPWTNTMWTRDAGVFLRELAQWGYYDHAVLLADNLMRLVEKNGAGYYTFPEHFDYGHPGSGSELDGTGAIIIGMALLYERLPANHPARERLRQFLSGAASPLAYIAARLARDPLIAGSGEFGGGVGVGGEYYNVVQNNLVRLALLAAAGLARQWGEPARAQAYADLAAQVSDNMLRILRDEDGAWIWCVDAATGQGNPQVLNHIANKGFGGINGVLAMSCDVAGFDPRVWDWAGVDAGTRTFEKLFAQPVRRAMFDKYGAWTQFDDFGLGYFTGPSYGHGYALQVMLLTDRLQMAGRALDFLAQATHTPPRGNVLTRDNDDYFYERYYLPELSDHSEAEVLARQPFFPLHTAGGHLDEGCGALNLVCVAEPLKVARLVAGIDDVAGDEVRLIPRLPPGWAGYEASHWPILTHGGVVYADIRWERAGADMALEVRIRVEGGGRIPRLAIRREPSRPDQAGWVHATDVTEYTLP